MQCTVNFTIIIIYPIDFIHSYKKSKAEGILETCKKNSALISSSGAPTSTSYVTGY